jgi:hypothetical protein
LTARRVLDEWDHRLDLAHAFAHQEQLVEDEEFRLAGQRRNVLHAGVAVLAVAAAALFDALGQGLRAGCRHPNDGGRRSEDQRP